MKIALIGKNISYSLSPVIHNYAAAHLGIEAQYDLLDVSEPELKDIINILSSRDITAFNVTKPYKEAICKHLKCDRQLAANTGVWDGDAWRLYSTDFIGLKRALERIGVMFEKDLDIIILGSGGAVVSILEGLYEMSLPEQSITVLRRNSASDAVLKHHGLKLNIEVCDFSVNEFARVTREKPNALIIQATPLPQEGDDMAAFANALPDQYAGSYYDLVYNAKNKLIDVFNEKGLRNSDGLSMLIEQARVSQSIWWQQSAPYERLLKEVKTYLLTGR